MKKISLFFTVLFIQSIHAQISFEEKTYLLGDSNISSLYVAIGVTDMNHDQLDDIIRISKTKELSIDYQQHDGTFQNIVVHPDAKERNWSMAIGDVNKNGLMDIFIGDDSISHIFYATDAGYYIRKDLSGNFFAQGANMVDIDNDGWIDIFVCNDDSTNHVYINDNTGNMIHDASINLGSFSGNYGSIWTDYDNDGDQDLYISKCRRKATSFTDPRRVNNLFQNDGNGVYTDVAASANVDDGAQSWAADFGDIDNDGDLDLLVINHYARNTIYENNGDGTFTDISSTSLLDSAFYIQVKFVDFDNDTYLDILFMGQGTRVYRNLGNNTFQQIKNAFPDTIYTNFNNFALGDLNNDGFVDLIVAEDPKPDNLYLNQGNSNSYIAINLNGVQSNRDAIGARIEIYGPWGIQVREVRSGESYGIMNSLTQYFGLGSATSIDSIVVRWPSGIITRNYNIAANQYFGLHENGKVEFDENVIQTNFNLYPNPVTNVSILEFDNKNNEKFDLYIYNEEGKLIERIPNITTSFVQISNKNLASGMYEFILKKGSEIVFRGKFVVLGS